jgi:hypothetical protein
VAAFPTAATDNPAASQPANVPTPESATPLPSCTFFRGTSSSLPRVRVTAGCRLDIGVGCALMLRNGLLQPGIER